MGQVMIPEQGLFEQIAEHFELTPRQVAHEGLLLFVEKKLRIIESELFNLQQRYGVQTVEEFDQAVRAGRFHEAEVFEDTFRFDHLEHERAILKSMLLEM